MSVRNLLDAADTALLEVFALAAPASNLFMTSGRLGSGVGALLGLIGVVIGGLALARSAGRRVGWPPNRPWGRARWRPRRRKRVRLVLFGANGPTGRMVAEMALAEGHAVTAVTRNPDSFPPGGPGLRVAAADALDAGAVDGAVAGHDAAISALGVPYTKETVAVFSGGTANIIRAMKNHGLRRLVCVSSMGVGVSPADVPDETLFFRRVVGPWLLRMGRTVYEDMRRMEDIVGGSGLDWTVVRPADLFDGEAVTGYQVSTRPVPSRFTSRRDLADLLLREAVEGRNAGRSIYAVTTEGVPTFARMFIKEALHIGK